MGVMHDSSLDADSGSSNHFSSHSASNLATDFRSLSKPQYEPRTVTCYGCGQAGHIRPNCPN